MIDVNLSLGSVIQSRNLETIREAIAFLSSAHKFIRQQEIPYIIASLQEGDTVKINLPYAKGRSIAIDQRTGVVVEILRKKVKVRINDGFEAGRIWTVPAICLKRV